MRAMKPSLWQNIHPLSLVLSSVPARLGVGVTEDHLAATSGHTFEHSRKQPFKRFLAIAITACLICPVGFAHAETTDKDQIVGMVIAGIEANYSQISSAYAELRMVSEDMGAPPGGKTVHETSSTTTTIWRYPKLEKAIKYWLRGDVVRVDSSPLTTMPGVGREILVRKDGVWTQYTPDSQFASIRQLENMPGRPPVDIRELASEDIKRGIIDVLREDKVVSAGLTDNRRGVCVARVITEKASGAQTIYEFGSAEGFLPIMVYTNWPDGSFHRTTDIEYEQVLDGQARFLKRATHRYYPEGVADTLGADGWHQRTSYEVVDLQINLDIPENQFVLDFAPGTRVVDNISHQIQRTPSPQPDLVASRLRTRWVMVVVSFLLLALAVGLFAARRSRVEKK